MAKDIFGWTKFLVELEAGKRIVAIFIVITIALSSVCISLFKKNENNSIKYNNAEVRHKEEISIIKDTCSAETKKLIQFYNSKIELMYIDQLDHMKQLEQEYKSIKKKNDKIISNNR